MPQLAEIMIRPAGAADEATIWCILEPVIRAGESYALPREMERAAALCYWRGDDRISFVAELDGETVGTYFLRANQAGGGDHVANCGYVTARVASGRGVARRMCEHSLGEARRCGFTAMQFNFVVASNTRAIRLWQDMGFSTVGRLPEAFRHPLLGPTDALIMFRKL